MSQVPLKFITGVGLANGLAVLDPSGKVPASQLPSTLLEYQGLWNPSTNTPALQDSTGTNAFVYQISVAFAGPISGLASPTMVNFQVGNIVIYSSAAGEWQQVASLSGVVSVNGATGAVTVNAINQLTGDVTASAASGSQSKATSLVATSNSTLTTLSALSLPGSQVTGNISGNAANISATSNSTLTTLSALSLPYSQLTGAPAALVFADSLVNTSGTVTLKNDSASPTASQYYGTNASSVLGYFNLPSPGAGTVTSVGLADSTGLFNITGTPVTTSGTLTLSTFKSQAQAAALIGPASGGAGAPSFRALVATDIPTLNQNTTGTAANITATSNSTLTTLSSLSLPGAQVTGNISGNAANITATSNSTLTTLSALSLPYSQLTGAPAALVFSNSLVNTSGTVTLKNDTASPTASQYYGTNGSSVLGYFNLPTAGTGTVTSVAMSVPAFLSVAGSPVTSSGTLAVSLSGTALPIANGGTGVTSVSTAPAATSFAGWDANKNLSSNSFISSATSTVTSATPVTLTVSSAQEQIFTGSTTQTVNLPVASTLANGQSFIITNLATTVTTVQTSGATVMQAMATNTQLVATVQNNAGGTGLASWTWTYTSAQTAAAGKLAIAVGGTGVTSVTVAPTASAFAGWDANKNLSGSNIIDGFTTTATAAGTTTLVIGSTGQQYFTGTNTQTVKLPTTSVVAGGSYTIVNLSAGNVTVQSSNASNIQVMTQNTQLVVTALIATPTTAANWNAVYSPLIASTSSGTVTSVSVVTANGFSGSVATSTTTPAITLTGTLSGDVTGTLNATTLTATTNSTITTLSALSLPVAQVTGAANTTLSNLGTTSISQALLPSADLTQNLGSVTARWNSLLVGNVQGASGSGVIDFTTINTIIQSGSGGVNTLRGVNQIGTSATTPQHQLWTATTTGASLGTLTNSPVAGNPAGYIQITINGSQHYIPYW